jgi:hypothetical protein
MPRKSRTRAVALSFLLLGSLAGVAEAGGRPAALKRSEFSWTFEIGERLMRHVRALLGSAAEKNGASLDPFGQPKPAEGSTDPSGQRSATGAQDPAGE